MLIKPAQINIDPNSNSINEEYDGIVVDNLDPLMLGRIRVSYSLVEDVEDDLLPWCYPSGNLFLGNSRDSIMLAVPEVGSEVKVYFPTRDRYMPYYKGTEFNTQNMCTFFVDEDYPQVYGFKDSVGNFVRINKRKKTIIVQHSSTANLTIKEDGSISYNLPDGSYFEMLSGGTWTISSGKSQTSVLKGSADGNVSLDCQSFTVNANSIVLNSPETSTTGSMTVGSADGGLIQYNNGMATVVGGIIVSLS